MPSATILSSTPSSSVSLPRRAFSRTDRISTACPPPPPHRHRPPLSSAQVARTLLARSRVAGREHTGCWDLLLAVTVPIVGVFQDGAEVGGGWERKAQTSGLVDKPSDLYTLFLPTFSARTPYVSSRFGAGFCWSTRDAFPTKLLLLGPDPRHRTCLIVYGNKPRFFFSSACVSCVFAGRR